MCWTRAIATIVAKATVVDVRHRKLSEEESCVEDGALVIR